MALLVVLAVVALLSGLVITLLGSASKQVSQSRRSAATTGDADLARLAQSQLLGDILQEIKAGSVEVDSDATTIRYPATPQSAVPDRSSASTGGSSATAPPPNLLKQTRNARPSYDGAAVFAALPVYPQASAYPVPNRASALSSSAGALTGGISNARWNQPLLLPRVNPDSGENLAPAASGTLRVAGNPRQAWSWRAPDWVFVTGDGANPVTWAPQLCIGERNPVVGRYACQVYDVGGLLDLNVAGYDPDVAVVGAVVAARRGSTGLADLGQIGLQAAHLKTLLAYRNRATLADADSIPGRISHGNRYVNFLLNGRDNLGFLRASPGSGSASVTNAAFTSRGGLLDFLQKLGVGSAERAALIDSAQYLTHFSRSLEQPSFKPAFFDPQAVGSSPLSPVFVRPSIVAPAGRVDDTLYPSSTIALALRSSGDIRRSTILGGPLPWEMALGNNRGGNDAWGTLAERTGTGTDTRSLQDVINPAFLEVRVRVKADSSKEHAFLRQDGSFAQVGEPLVKRRFPLERLAWLTFRGPSATLPSSDPQFNKVGTAEAIYDCFGLTWSRDASGSFFWAYDHGKTGGIFRLEELLAVDALRRLPREPDFFELLKAAIGVGSLGKSSVATHLTDIPSDCATFSQVRDRSSNFQILEIGANLIDQYDPDSFPTLLKLPNPDPSLTTNAARYASALFTARGIEDLPYFYRFHWRGIEDANDAPNKVLPAPGGITEITGNLGDFAGSKFKCGTTAILGFPELWNPHALSGTGVEPGLAPASFRVVAASETPGDVLDPPKDPANPVDKGLSRNPKLGALPTLSDASKLWVQYVNSGWYHFVIRPTGFSAYCAGGSMLTWLHSQAFSTLSSTMGLNTNNWTWTWPLDNQQTSFLTTSAAGDYRSHSLFWNNAPVWLDNASVPALGARVANYFFSLVPLWRLPDSVLSDADFPLQPMPANWPASTARFSGKQFGPVASITDFPATGDSTVLYRLSSGKAYTWDSSIPAYQEVVWPAVPDVNRSFVAATYRVGAGSLTYGNGTLLPHPYPPYRQFLNALTDRAGVRRVLFDTNPTQVIPPGSPTPASGGNAQNNRTIDLRGSELLFAVGSNALFREPTTLCQPGLPVGSNLTAGNDNFFAGSPYNGSLQSADGNRWVGFSLGELPSQFLVAAKIFKRDKVGAYRNGSFPSLGMAWAVDGNDPALDVFQNKLGAIYADPSSNWMIVPPAANPPRPGPAEFYKLRFFHVPVTLAGIQRTQLTIRVQYRDPVSSQWVTYDERMIDVNPDQGARWSSAPVLGKSELQPGSLPAPQDAGGNVLWRDNRRTLGWSLPVVTSYDPRTPRFGQPMRSGYNFQQNLRGTNARDLQLLNPSAADPWDPGYFPKSDPLVGRYNITDRPANSVVDLPVAGTRPGTVTPRWWVPAYWNSWFNGGNGGTYKDGYDYAVGAKAADGVGSPQAWAQARHPSSGRLLYQMPSASAADYGWYPRFLPTPPAGSYPSSAIKAGSASKDATIPVFFNDGPGGYYADALRIGDFSENVPPSTATPTDPSAPYRQAYADPDDVFRRAAGGLASGGGYSGVIEGLPMGQGTGGAASNRPILLNRPFRSVAEMAAAFRGTPWKHLSFFQPETADAALLDVFCLTEAPPLDGAVATPLVAGKVNLNTRQEPVLRALLSGALKDELGGGTLSAGAAGEAGKAAAALVDRTTGTRPWLGPLTNNAELAGKLFAKDLLNVGTVEAVYTSTVYRTTTTPARNADMQPSRDRVDWHFTGFSADLGAGVLPVSKDRKTQRLRESAIRALADGGQTRVWNLMLDLVVQTGGIPRSATGLEGFVRQSERRLWVFVAIDRLTGEILEQQTEWVTD
jgi:type II secretory pathway pseudopilin PulG